MRNRQATYSQRSFLLRIYVASIVVIIIYLALSPLLKPDTTRLILLAMLGCALVGGYAYTSQSRHYTRSSHYYTVCCYATIISNALLNGGIGAPGTIWFLLCPLIAFITLSTRVARIWLIIILATVLLLFIFKKQVGSIEYKNLDAWYFTSYMLFFPMVYSIMRIFRREVSKKNVALNVLNQRLKVEREMLQHTQQEILCQSARIKEEENKAQARSLKLSFYLNQLIEVKRMEEVHSGNLEYAIQAVLQFLQKSMMLKNVALWHAEGHGQPLERLRHIGNDGSNASEPAFLYREQFVEAYEMLQTGAIINQCDNTREAAQLKTLFKHAQGNDSMINCPYFLEGKFAGFISCRASDRLWVAEDIIFVRAISDTISLAFKSHHRIVQQQMLEQKQREITEMNELLERKVKTRTQELNLRNKQLTDFSFTNAHHIRGPLCRLLGLKNLLSATTDCREVLKIADYMTASITELDNTTRETSKKLNALVEDKENFENQNLLQSGE